MGVRVLHVVPAFSPTRGGIEVLVEGLTPVLERDHGVKSAVLAPRQRGQRPDDCVVAGARVYSIDLIDGRETRHEARELAEVFSSVRRSVTQERPDLIHVHGYSPLALPSISIARSMGLPHIMHVHGGVEAPLPDHFHRLVREAPLVIAVSDHVEASLRSVSGRTGPIQVVPNGLVFPETDESAPCLNSTRVGMCGRLEPEKGFAEAIQALAPLRHQFPGLEIHLVGVGGELIRIQQVARESGLARALVLHGEVSHDEALRVIQSCSVVVVPSLSVEGFSLVAAEAGLMARPVVATRVGGLAETVIDGVTGTLVAPREPEALLAAVAAYLDEPSMRLEHGNSARASVKERFSMSSMAASLAEAYASLRTREERM